MNSDNFTDIYYRLQYFYFIQPEPLLKIIQSKASYKEHLENPSSEHLTALFDDIFTTIFRYSHYYTQYLNPNTFTNSFFGEGPLLMDKQKSYRSGSCNLIRLSLLHHCIIQTFYNLLKNIHQDKTSDYKMNSKHHFLFQNGYFGNLDYMNSTKTEDIQLKKHDNSIQYRALYSQRYKAFDNLNENSYSKKLLFSVLGKLPPKEDNKKSAHFFHVPPYLNLWADFIFSSKSVHYFDKSQTKGNPLFPKYASIFSDYNDYLNIAKINADKLLFSYPIECSYSFQTCYGLLQLLTTINNCESLPNARTYKDLEGNILLNIMKLLKNNPLVYNRHFLLKYACDAICMGELCQTRYLNISASSVITKMTDDFSTENAKIAYGLSLAEKFLMHINNIVIPLITDLWNYIIHSLPDNIISIENLREYINCYYPLITADWALFTPNEISKYGSYDLSDLSEFRSTLKKDLLDTKKSLDFSLPKRNFVISNNMEELLKHYCDIDSNFQITYIPPDIRSQFYNFLPKRGVDKNSEQIFLDSTHQDHAKILYSLSTNSFGIESSK